MPKKNIVKKYVPGGFYHIYNRGINKGKIFLDLQDYNVFLKYLTISLSIDRNESLLTNAEGMKSSNMHTNESFKEVDARNYHDEIFMISYCLMPNHFHFLVKQRSAMSIADFLKSLSTRYVMYFNKKYRRVGPLFESKYKGVLITSPQQLLYVTKYIHRNPLKIVPIRDPVSKRFITQPSSYSSFINFNTKKWLYPELIIDNSKKIARAIYKKFVEEEGSDPVQLSDEHYF